MSRRPNSTSYRAGYFGARDMQGTEDGATLAAAELTSRHFAPAHKYRALTSPAYALLLRRRCLFTMSNHTQAITQVKWGGDGLIYSAARDCSINVWDGTDGKLVRRWVAWHAHPQLTEDRLQYQRVGQQAAACST